MGNCGKCKGVGLNPEDKTKHCQECFTLKDPKFYIWESNNKLGPVFINKDHFKKVMEIYKLSALQTMRTLQKNFGGVRVYFNRKAE